MGLRGWTMRGMWGGFTPARTLPEIPSAPFLKPLTALGRHAKRALRDGRPTVRRDVAVVASFGNQ